METLRNPLLGTTTIQWRMKQHSFTFPSLPHHISAAFGTELCLCQICLV